MVDWSYSATQKSATWNTSANERGTSWKTNPTDSDRFSNWNVSWVSSRGYWKNLNVTKWLVSTNLRWNEWFDPQMGPLP